MIVVCPHRASKPNLTFQHQIMIVLTGRWWCELSLLLLKHQTQTVGHLSLPSGLCPLSLVLLHFDHWTSKYDLLGNWKLWRGSWVIIQCGWLLRHPTISSCVVYYSTLKTFPPCNFSPDFPETLSQNLICCYRLSVSGYNALWDTH